jgi:amino acid transporter
MVKNKNNHNKIKNESSKLLTTKDLVWLGFNYMVAISFVITFGGKTGIITKLGLWIFLVIIFCAFISAGSGFAYAKCSQIFKNSNGSSYVYVRGAFGRFWGWIIGFLQYCCLPASGITFIFTMVTANLKSIPYFDNGHPFADGDSLRQDLYFNLFGILLFFLFSFLIFFGLKFFKWAFNFTLFIQWFVDIIVLIIAIYIFFENGAEIINKNINFTKNKVINFSNFFNSFNEFIFFVLGFEVFTTINKNIKNPQKTISKSIFYVLLSAIIFYLFVTTLVIGSIDFSDEEKHENPLNEIILKKLGNFGVIILVISMIALKINASQGASLYSGACLEPLSVEGYISKKLTFLTKKDNLPIRASLFNSFLTILLAFVFLILPFVYKGEVNPADVFGFIAIISIIVHIFVLLSAFKLYVQKFIKFKSWELVWLFFTFISLFFAGVQYFINLFSDKKIINFISISLIFSLILFSILWYYFYYFPLYKKRLKEKPELQKKLDSFFKPII